MSSRPQPIRNHPPISFRTAASPCLQPELRWGVSGSVDGGFWSPEPPTTAAQKIDRLSAEVLKLEKRVAELEKLAHRDCLLGIPNRRCFFEKLDRIITRVETHDVTAAMLLVDLNRLKEINDTFGHNAGDEALIEVARLLVQVVQKTDCVGRLGGDEFGILLEHTDEQSAGRTAFRVCEAVGGSPLRVEDDLLSLGVAVGITMIVPGDTPKMVVERADKEMYRMKRNASLDREVTDYACLSFLGSPNKLQQLTKVAPACSTL